MSPSTLGLLIGGVFPALFFGLSGFFSKVSAKAGIGTGLYIIVGGIGVIAVGIGYSLMAPDRTISVRSSLAAFAMGASWGIGACLVAFALNRYQVPLGKIVPLYNGNTLVAVLLALIVFSEWKDVRVMQLLLGAVMIVAGSVVVSRA